MILQEEFLLRNTISHFFCYSQQLYWYIVLFKVYFRCKLSSCLIVSVIDAKKVSKKVWDLRGCVISILPKRFDSTDQVCMLSSVSGARYLNENRCPNCLHIFFFIVAHVNDGNQIKRMIYTRNAHLSTLQYFSKRHACAPLLTLKTIGDVQFQTRRRWLKIKSYCSTMQINKISSAKHGAISVGSDHMTL